MNELYGIVTGGALITALAVVLHIHMRKQQLARQMLGLSWLQSLKSLLSNIQQHRGLSSGYLNGETELLAQIQSLQGQVSRDIDAIRRVDEWMENNDRWIGINQHWARLAGNFKHNAPENNLHQHNMLIQNILYLIDDMALHHGLLRLKVQEGKPFYLLWRDLLSASEYIGQARAVGMGVTARGGCDSISRIKLNYLSKKIDENTSAVWRELDVSDQCRSSTQDLLNVIRTEVVMEEVALSPKQYFTQASRALDALHNEYDSLIESVRWHIR
ncbi:MAG: nitrate- and nitrite sensing domain-containing protein [Pseudomonadota bacterium]|nr:nitrate- and nitrite sensing domain-containing protein [Pseudomonadota bacterium]